jgi:hypothetical protein
MGLSLVDSHNGPLNLVIPPTHVVTTRWLVQVATELEHAVGNRPHIELKEEGICLEVPRGAFTQRSRLMHLELPNPVEPTSEALESPRVLYYSKPDRAGFLCAGQPTSGQSCASCAVRGRSLVGKSSLGVWNSNCLTIYPYRPKDD